MIELWHPRYVEASKTSKEHVYVHFSYFWPSSTTLWPIMYDIEKSWKMWFWPKIIIFFQGSKWAKKCEIWLENGSLGLKKPFSTKFRYENIFWHHFGKIEFLAIFDFFEMWVWHILGWKYRFRCKKAQKSRKSYFLILHLFPIKNGKINSTSILR